MEKTGRNRGQISIFKIVALAAMKQLESDPNYQNQKSVRAELVEASYPGTSPSTGSGRTGLSEQYWVLTPLTPLTPLTALTSCDCGLPALNLHSKQHRSNIMRVVNFSEARNSLKSVIDQVIEDADYTVIARRDAPDAVVMSLDTFNSLMETVCLLYTSDAADE